MQRGVVFDIKRYAIHDGPGIRVTVFLKGCPLDCWWCHNPEGRQPEPQVMARPAGAGGEGRGRPVVDPQERVGRFMTVSELMREVERETLFLDESGGGVTFSGGEPLMQPEFLAAALRACKSRELETALDTSGYAPPDLLRGLLDDVDLVLYDLKLIDDQAHRRYTGVSNGPILANFRTLVEYRKAIRIRFPLIPGVTDTEGNLAALIDLVARVLPGASIDLLGYHRTGESKYPRLGMSNRMAAREPPSPEELAAVAHRLESAGFRVKIGA